jgi:ATP-dependent protease Clp ATPase subunit
MHGKARLDFEFEFAHVQARQKGTGARGLRSILENVLLEAQYHVCICLTYIP